MHMLPASDVALVAKATNLAYCGRSKKPAYITGNKRNLQSVER